MRIKTVFILEATVTTHHVRSLALSMTK